MYVILDHIEDTATNVKTFWLAPEHPVQYVAGEYFEMLLPHANPDNRGERRWFSLSSSPTEPLLGVTVKFEHTGGSTYKQALLSLQPGDKITVSDPMGDFVLPKDPAIPLVFIAAGIGITPVRGMVRWLMDKQEQRDLQLIYITPTPSDMLFLPLFNAYEGLRLNAVHTRSPAETERPRTGDFLRLIGKPTGKLVYLSGPQPLIEGLWADLQEHGFDRSQLILDYFPGYTQL
jgi:ferredoxin-NADP reductase